MVRGNDHRRLGWLVVLAVLVSLVGPPAMPAVVAPAQADAGEAGDDPVGQRFLDEVFPSVTVTKDILYTRQVNVGNVVQDLHLDLYEPVGDSRRDRPLIVWVHGGGFAAGTKQGGNDVEMGTHLAKRGFVVASIDYRLDPDNGWGGFDDINEAMSDERFLLSVLRATADLGVAVKFFRERAVTYGVHPEAIFAAGYSAGAVTSLTQAYLPSQSWLRQERLAAVASLAGTTQSWYVEPGEPPSIMLHGTKDTTVPYGAAKSFCQTAATRTGCRLVTYTGGHGITPDGDWSDLREQVSRFFYEAVLDGLGFTTEVNPLGGSSTIHPVTPTRMVDTRAGLGHPRALGPGGSLELDPRLGGTVPTEASGVIVNVTVTGASEASHLTVWPSGTPLPGTSNLNWDAGHTRANLVTTRLGPGGIAVRNNTGTVDVIVDVVAWLGPDPSDGRLHRVDPFRLVDTRDGTGAPSAALGPGEVLVVDSRRGPVPSSGVSGVVANVTATAGTAASHLSVWPGGGPAPEVSTLNWPAGATVANQIVMGVAPDGTFSVRNNRGAVHVVVDVVAWLGPDPVGGVGCTLIDPVRVLDTRDGVGAPAIPAQAGVTLNLGLAGHAEITSSASAAFTNTTVTGGTAASHLTVWPTGTAMPTVSSLNWAPGETVPNHVVAALGDDTAVSYVTNAGAVDLIVDLTGWC